MKRIKFIEQMSNNDCGFSCLAMILNHYDSYYDVEELKTNQINNSRDGLNIFDMKNIAKQCGLDSKVFRFKEEVLFTLNRPIILLSSKKNHFVVFEKHKNGVFTIHDPAISKLSITAEELNVYQFDYFLYVAPDENFEKKQKKSSFRHLKTYLLKERNKVALFLLLSLALNLLSLLTPILVSNIIDNINNSDISSGYFYVILVFTIYGLYFIVSRLNTYNLTTFSKNFNLDYGGEIYKRMLSMNFSYFQSRSFGDLLYRVSSVSIIEEILSNNILNGFIDVIFFVVLMFYLFFQSIELTIVVMSLLIASIAITLFFRRKIIILSKKEIKSASELNAFQTETMYNIFNIKSLGEETDKFNEWTIKKERNIDSLNKYRLESELFNSIIVTFSNASPLLILILAVTFYSDSMSLGSLIAYYSVSIQLFQKSNVLTGIFTSSILMRNYLTRVNSLLDTEGENIDSGNIIDLKGNIELKSVSFGYSEKKILENINLSITSGEKIAIIGSSGAGKSTLAKLIIGLYEPHEGEILYDGFDISSLNKQHVRKQMGIIPQEVTLTNDSIKNNISKTASIESIKRAAKDAEVYDEIINFPMKFNTIVGEMGITLSGGQRQRILIARALINNPKIVLFDEATSSLDYQNERKIDKLLRNNNSTRIIISHKLSSVKNADKIIIVNQKNIEAIGTHEELICSNNYYKEFFHK